MFHAGRPLYFDVMSSTSFFDQVDESAPIMTAAAAATSIPEGDLKPQPADARRRRRRAPATGAADDCFACRRRHIKCDRRRPYCSQCLEQGKDCSGYKTQLTWGVGVASRGKLRGQALPIAKTVNASPKSSHRRSRRSSSATTDSFGASPRLDEHPAEVYTTAAQDLSPPLMGVPANDGLIRVKSSASYGPVMLPPQAFPSTQSDYSLMEAAPMPNDDFYAHGGSPPGLVPLNTPLAGTYEDYGQPSPASSIPGFGENAMASPINLPQTPKDASLMFASLPVYDALPPQQPVMQLDRHPVPVQQQQRRSLPTSYPHHQLLRTRFGHGLGISSSFGPLGDFYASGGGEALTKPAPAPTNVTHLLFEDDFSNGGIMTGTGHVDPGYGYVTSPSVHS